jgi:hypothetical protein
MATLSASDQAWNTYMGSSASKQNPFTPGAGSLMAGVGTPRDSSSASGPIITGSDGQQYQKLKSTGASGSGGYVNIATGETVSGISRKATGGNISYSSGGGGGGGYSLSSQSGSSSPVEFYLGASPTLKGIPNAPVVGGPGTINAPSIGNLTLPNAPQLQGLDYSSVFNQFRSVFSNLNSGVNPEYGVDVIKLAKDAKAVSAELNLSPSQIKAMISQINPTTGEIIADVKQATDALNNPDELADKSGKIADALNKKYQDEFDSAMPGYKANMSAANRITNDYLAGKIPQDVVDQVVRNSAAKGFATGLMGGGIGRNIVARDLGLTSLQLQTAGANLLQQTANIANSVIQSTMPVSGESFVSQFMTDPGQIFSSISNMKRVDPTSIFNAVYVPTSQVFDKLADMAQASTTNRANFEASKLISPSSVFNALTDQATYNQQINTQNLLNNWETSKTMALGNQQIAEKNAINQWENSKFNAVNKYEADKFNAMNQWQADQYNSQIANQNAINAWQGQGLPGQYDVNRGAYIGFQPGTYSATRPNLPGSEAALSAASSGDFMVNMGGAMVPASKLKGIGGQQIVANLRAQATQQAQQQSQNWTGVRA